MYRLTKLEQAENGRTDKTTARKTEKVGGASEIATLDPSNRVREPTCENKSAMLSLIVEIPRS